jgi:hypothetical protein
MGPGLSHPDGALYWLTRVVAWPWQELEPPELELAVVALAELVALEAPELAELVELDELPQAASATTAATAPSSAINLAV